MASSVHPRVLKLTKQDGQSYGFFLRIEKGKEGHLVRNVGKGGPAENAGMKDGDRILRVNGVFVDKEDHSRVVNLVKESGLSVTFQVLDEESYEMAKEKGISLSEEGQAGPAQQPVMNGVAGATPKPKLCYLVKGKKGYGFSLTSRRGVQGIFFSEVHPSGVAAMAGVQNNDRLIELNGDNIESSNHEQIVDKVKASGKSIVFLVVDGEADRYYKNKQIKLAGAVATVKHLPHKPRIAELTKGPDGYGFYLRQQHAKLGHFIKDIDAGSPADKAGLKDMDRLVAVNGDPVDSLEHEQVVEKIRQCGKKSTLLVVDRETDQMYTMACVSPLLYWDEVMDSHREAAESAAATPSHKSSEHKPIPAAVTPSQESSEHKPIAAAATPSQDSSEHKPRLCLLEKTSGGFGFHLNAIRGLPGQFVKEVANGSPADKAGLVDDNIVIEVNGDNVENKLYEEVVEMIKKSGNRLEMLVIEKAAYDYFKDKNIPITTALIGTKTNKPATPPVKAKEPKNQEDHPAPAPVTAKAPSPSPPPSPTIAANLTPPPSSAPAAAPSQDSPKETRKRSVSSSSSASEDERF
ncbi:Na(+)/H(+) exchange regulatory cofactor NHE-RF3-like [Polyodon spathula]|uniref:Na(+)/H(+) exchange regulatory cofactor NHE-RF3-like n=1 Tax=Polyodon spathula TaxID=7913 RepID=UPI001B7E2CF5|nr:Na(+)/H(+) exchange regulatory cofactor NHE-RF3-like [Polyodon spathula]